jgi:hypothetical protein
MQPIENLYKFAPELFKNYWSLESPFAENAIKVRVTKEGIKAGKHLLIPSDIAYRYAGRNVFIYHTEDSVKACGGQKVYQSGIVFKSKTKKDFLIEYMSLITFKGYFYKSKWVTLSNSN